MRLVRVEHCCHSQLSAMNHLRVKASGTVQIVDTVLIVKKSLSALTDVVWKRLRHVADCVSKGFKRGSKPEFDRCLLKPVRIPWLHLWITFDFYSEVYLISYFRGQAVKKQTRFAVLYTCHPTWFNLCVSSVTYFIFQNWSYNQDFTNLYLTGFNAERNQSDNRLQVAPQRLRLLSASTATIAVLIQPINSARHCQTRSCLHEANRKSLFFDTWWV